MTSTEKVWTQFSDRLRAFIGKRVRGESDVDDILQEVFSKIHAGMGSLKEDERIEAWLFQVARHAVLDFFRGRAGKRRTTELPEDLAVDPDPGNVSGEVASWLDPMMSLLPKEDQEALRLADLQGLSQKDLAVRLGLSATAAKSRVQRARLKLRAAVLECCHVELDRRGNAIDYSRKGRGCGPCSCSCC